MVSPAAEVDIDERMLRSLLTAQHPDLADLPVHAMDHGWDNALWRVGDDLLARLPRRALAATLTINEQRWLPELAPMLTLPVPVPIRVGRPSATYPWPWSIVPWIDGIPGDRVSTVNPTLVAGQLGRFLHALHQPAPVDAPRNSFRGVPLVERAEAFEQRLAELSAEIDIGPVRATWAQALDAASWSGAPLWLHGDLHPANLLVDDGILAAVLDFGDLCAGDPATDLAAAWMLLPPSAIPVFVQAYGGIADELGARTRGWAVLFGLMLVAIGLDDRPTYEPIGRRALANAAAGAES